MDGTVWEREVAGRLAAQYPRVPRADVDELVGLWTRLLRVSVPPQDLPRVVEEQLRSALHGVAVPQQRARADVRLRL